MRHIIKTLTQQNQLNPLSVLSEAFIIHEKLYGIKLTTLFEMHNSFTGEISILVLLIEVS